MKPLVTSSLPPALYALAIGAFGIGTTEFVVMGLLPQVSKDLNVSLTAAGLLITGYALGVVVGAPLLTALAARLSHKTLLVALLGIFTVGNLLCAMAPTYEWLMVAQVTTSLTHGAFFGIGSVVATGLVAPNRRASAIALLFTGLTLANILGVPFGTWLGQAHGWRATFWAVAALGPLALAAVAYYVPSAAQATPIRWAEEWRVLGRPAVLLSLLVTALGFGGVFTVFTYISPLLTQVTGFTSAALAPILLVFGGGLVLGNWLGGKLADRHLLRTLLGSLLGLVATLMVIGVGNQQPELMVGLVGLLGITGFATVPPLQLRILRQTVGAPVLASALNIAAFNLGNALGAWAGGQVLERGGGLPALPWVACGITGTGLVLAFASTWLDKRPTTTPSLIS